MGCFDSKQKKASRLTYRWWKKSCTTPDGQNPVNNGIIIILGGAGFCPSTLSPFKSVLLTSDVFFPTFPFFPGGIWVHEPPWKLVHVVLGVKPPSCFPHLDRPGSPVKEATYFFRTPETHAMKKLVFGKNTVFSWKKCGVILCNLKYHVKIENKLLTHWFPVPKTMLFQHVLWFIDKIISFWWTMTLTTMVRFFLLGVAPVPTLTAGAAATAGVADVLACTVPAQAWDGAWGSLKQHMARAVSGYNWCFLVKFIPSFEKIVYQMPLIFGSLFLFGEEGSQSILWQQGKHFGASSIHSYNSTDSQVQSFFGLNGTFWTCPCGILRKPPSLSATSRSLEQWFWWWVAD